MHQCLPLFRCKSDHFTFTSCGGLHQGHPICCWQMLSAGDPPWPIGLLFIQLSHKSAPQVFPLMQSSGPSSYACQRRGFEALHYFSIPGSQQEFFADLQFCTRKISRYRSISVVFRFFAGLTSLTAGTSDNESMQYYMCVFLYYTLWWLTAMMSVVFIFYWCPLQCVYSICLSIVKCGHVYMA